MPVAVMDRLSVTLNSAEQRLAQYLARSRYLANRSTNTVDRKVGPQSCEATDLQGIAAEIAFARLVNVYPDLAVDSRPHYDVLVPTPRGILRVDVKCTAYPNGKMLAVLGKRSKRADVYVLMVGAFPTYRLAGGEWGRNLFLDSRIQDLGYGPTYAVNQRDLYPWECLITY